MKTIFTFLMLKVLEMRNPWGNEHEWNGQWKDDDNSNWTPELRQQHNMAEPKPDGRFFMPFEDFIKFFDQYAICMYEDTYLLSSFTEELESDFKSCYKFTVTQAGDYFVSLSQPDQRGFPELPDGNRKFLETYSRVSVQL